METEALLEPLSRASAPGGRPGVRLGLPLALALGRPGALWHMLEALGQLTLGLIIQL